MGELYEFKSEDAFRFASDVHAETFAKGDELHFKYCPYCGGGKNKDKNTFSISLANGAFNCKRGSCGRKGNMITLAQDFTEFSLGDDGIDDYYKKRERFRKIAKRPVPIRDGAIEYLGKRGIPEEITRRYQVTTHKDNDNVMVFPFYDENDEFWFIKYRNIIFEKGKTNGSKEWCERGKKPILFGMNHVNFENKVLVMTEGQIDSLSCAAAGIENAVSVPFGKNGFTWVPYCFNFLSRFDELVVFGDYENGEISLLEGMKTRFRGTVKHVRPEDYKDCKDANEILLEYGSEAVRECVENAVPVPVPGLRKFRDIQRVNLRNLERMDTGIKEIDKKVPFYFGELIILTGSAGDGKSTLASQWATMAIDQGYPTMIYSGEMSDYMAKNWIDFQLAGKHHLNDYDDIDEETYERIRDWPEYGKLYYYDAEELEDESSDTIFTVLKEGIQQYGIRFIVIDNMMTAMDSAQGPDLNQAQTAFTKRLAKVAQESNVIIILIAHPRKGRLGSFSNDDIAGSSNVVNRAHRIIRYSRPEEKELREADDGIRILTVLKDRFAGHVITNGIALYFEELTKRISDDGKFDWSYGWETSPDGFDEIDDDEIPF